MLFRPTRASPPSPLRPVLPANLTLALSTQSSVSSLPLDGSTLTPEQIEILDTIIARAPPTATTFLAVFKAYNEVLQERGMDAGEDVVFYRFLLKLGVVRGQDWGERWNTVKSGLGSPVCSSDEEDTPSRKLPPNPKIAAREQLPQRSWTRHLLDDDSNVLHAQGDDTISLDNQPHSTPRGNSLPPLPSHKALEPSHAHPRLMRNQNLSNDRPQTSFSLRTVSRSPSPERRDHLRDHKHWDTNDPHDHDKEALSSLRPPSYRTLPQENSRPGNRNITFLQHLQAQLQDLPSSKPRKSQKTEHQKVSEPVREKAPPTKQEGHVNADEAWRLLEMERDAVEFWEMRLLRQHWDAWRSGFDWVRVRRPSLFHLKLDG
jgi:protein SFI1